MEDTTRIFKNSKNKNQKEEEEEDFNYLELRRGPWTPEEDLKLFNYISAHGEGRWNSLAHSAGLNRSGKSCRLRWLNYLRPDVRRGNITLEEQLLILDLHFRWGNRWSKIAQCLPGRTDNEIKNFWRTRVQKHAKKLKCDVNSKQFRDTMKYIWMPRMLEKIQSAGNSLTTAGAGNSASCTPDSSATTAATSDSFGSTQLSQGSDYGDCLNQVSVKGDPNPVNYCSFEPVDTEMGNVYGGPQMNGVCSQPLDQNLPWMDGGDATEDILWNFDDFWFWQQQPFFFE